MIEENTPQQNIERKIENDWKKSLCTVTPLSKYFAMVLFIILPFLGFWGGRLFEQTMSMYSVGPWVACESELRQCKSANTVVPQSTIEVKQNALTPFSDPDTGVSFTYPSQWGEVTVHDERGECDESLKDPCNMRTYSFDELVEGGIFLVMETSGHEESPLPRGGFWGDDIGAVTSSFADDCEQDMSCVVLANTNGVVFAKRSTEVFDLGIEDDSVPLEAMYDTYSDKGSYYAVRLSPLGIREAGDSIAQEFETTVITSLKLEAHK
jgi:hypothetical protein